MIGELANLERGLTPQLRIGWFTVSQLGCNLKRKLGPNLSKLEAKFEPSWCANRAREHDLQPNLRSNLYPIFWVYWSP